jgi:hypothetical protein
MPQDTDGPEQHRASWLVGQHASQIDTQKLRTIVEATGVIKVALWNLTRRRSFGTQVRSVVQGFSVQLGAGKRQQRAAIPSREGASP